MASDIGYWDGVIFQDGRMFFVASSAKLEQESVEHAFIFRLNDKDWYFWDEDFDVIRIIASAGLSGQSLVEMGMYGDIRVISGSGAHREIIGDDEDGPSELRPLNDMKQIGDRLYVVGMRRQVFSKNVDDTRWKNIDQGIFIPIDSEIDEHNVEGLTCIDGFNTNEIYAAGYEGQIWRYDGKNWAEISTSTNLRFEDIKCLRSGSVVAVGEMGLIVIGRDNDWKILRQDLVSTTFTSVNEMAGKIFLVSEEEGIFIMQDGDLARYETGLRGPTSFRVLRTNGSLLLSIGEADILLYDGVGWSRLDPPDIPEAYKR